MKRCFGYIRVSTQKQGEGVSLEAQKEAIAAYAAREELAIIRWFQEKETAAKSGRRIFNQMIRELKRGKAQGLVMHKVDRSARNAWDGAAIGDLPDAGIDVHFATESLDFSSRGGRLTADIQAVIAADYIRNLREETIKGITGRLKQGLYPFKAPIGYLDNGGGKLKTIDPIRGPLVRRAFDLYDSGRYSFRSLLTELKRLGLRSERGKPITKTCLETMLANPFYCGIIRIKRTGATYKGAHEPLISVELFEEVQARKAGRAVKKKTKHQFTYRSLFRCGLCGASMIAERQKGHVYYRCQTTACATKTVREELIEDATWEVLRTTRLSEIDVERLARGIEAWLQGQDSKGQMLALSNEIDTVQSKLDRLTDALIDRLIDRETYTERKETLVLERARLEERRKKAEQSGPEPEQIRKFLELAKNLAATYQIAEPAEKREIVEIATSNRAVSGRSIYLKPSEWLQQTTLAIAGLSGCPDQTTNRTDARRAAKSDSSDEVSFERLATAIESAPNLKRAS